MKRSLANIAMALCIGLFAACSQEEIITSSNGEVERVNIDAQLPQTVGTRALPGAEANHQLRCILEVWDKAENGKLITRIEKLASSATEGKLQFSFTVGKDVNYQCLLWADFIASDAGTSATADGNTTYTDKYFTTTNLKAIDFAVADASLFNNASTDAFCGAVDKNGTISQLSVTLKRPFTKVTLTDKSDYIDGCKDLAVAYNTPSGYNIATGVATTTKAVNATGLTVNGKTWFSTFIFASADKPKLDQDIVMKVTTANGTDIKTIKGGQISLDSNVENNAEANFSTDNDVDLDVDIDGDMEDPNAPKIGQFVNKDGSFTNEYNAETAIAIVFATAKGKNDASNYGDAFTGKKAYGYAMGLTSVTRSFLGITATEPVTLPTVPLTGAAESAYTENDYNGFTYTNALLTKEIKECRSLAFDGYATWLTGNTLEAPNVSSWYIPSGRQIYDMGCMLFGLKSGDAIDETVKNTLLINAYNTVVAGNSNAIFDLGGVTGACWMMSSYMSEGNLAVITTNKPKNSTAEIPIPGVSTAKAPWAPGSRVAIRPVITIFKQ